MQLCWLSLLAYTEVGIQSVGVQPWLVWMYPKQHCCQNAVCCSFIHAAACAAAAAGWCTWGQQSASEQQQCQQQQQSGVMWDRFCCAFAELCGTLWAPKHPTVAVSPLHP